MSWHTQLTAILGLCMLASCSSTDVAMYAGEKPVLDLQQYFNGTIDAWGMFQNRKGEVVKRFSVVIRCDWKGDVGTFDEDFSYSDGTRQKRVWTIRKRAAGLYIGTAADVVGEAVGMTSGNALRWKYVLALPVDGRTYNVNFEDWMFLMDGQVMLNRAVMSKFGFRLGEITLSFNKRSSAGRESPSMSLRP